MSQDRYQWNCRKLFSDKLPNRSTWSSRSTLHPSLWYVLKTYKKVTSPSFCIPQLMTCMHHQKSSKYRYFNGVSDKRSIMVFLTHSVRFKTIPWRYFLKIVISENAGLHKPPSHSDFDGLPYPRVRWYPNFFHQNDRKGCKWDYLDALGHFFAF